MRRSHAVFLALVLLLYGGVKGMDWWRHHATITLHVKDAPLGAVLAEVARQGRRPVLASTNLSQKVTVNFVRAQMEEALDVLADQSDGRWQKLFLVARSAGRLSPLALEVADRGPPSLLTRMPGVEEALGPPPERFEIAGGELREVLMKLSLNSRTPIALEDSFNPSIPAKSMAGDLNSLVTMIARAAGARSQMAYHFRVSRRFTGGGEEGDGRRRRNDRSGEEAAPSSEPGTVAPVSRMAAMLEGQLPLLTPEDQEKVKSLLSEMEQQRAAREQMTPEQRREARVQQENGGGRQARAERTMLRRIKNLTPEQMQARFQRMAQRDQRRQQAQQQTGTAK